MVLAVLCIIMIKIYFMRIHIVFVAFMLISISAFAQRIEFDIFDNLVFKSDNSRYEAYLKKNIFDDLIFTDNNENEVTYKNKYLTFEYPGVLEREENKIGFFRQLIHQYRKERNYKATFSVNIMDKIVIEDNRNNKIEMGTDIFGNPTYEELIDGVKMSVKKSLNGNWEYRSGKNQATLGKDIFDKWTYKDNSGNKFEFSENSWRKLQRRYGSEEDIFYFLLDEFLLRH